jgi:hypothetical protein
MRKDIDNLANLKTILRFAMFLCRYWELAVGEIALK